MELTKEQKIDLEEIRFRLGTTNQMAMIDTVVAMERIVEGSQIMNVSLSIIENETMYTVALTDYKSKEHFETGNNYCLPYALIELIDLILSNKGKPA